ncbi:MAG: hypothetical protein QW755_02395 [Nitrososphaerota archaeon]
MGSGKATFFKASIVLFAILLEALKCLLSLYPQLHLKNFFIFPFAIYFINFPSFPHLLHILEVL